MGLTITYGAYMAEVYRAGIEAVPHGQVEAARSLGMTHGQAMRYVIVPQAVRTVIPPLLNDFIALMKDTSLVSVLGFVEVVQAGRDVQSEFFNSSGLMLGALAIEGFLPRDVGIPRWFGKPDPFWYGIIALTVTYGAYMAEVYRAGIEAVPEGQMEAARSLGMSHGQAMRQVIVPQAVRKVIPPLLNDFIALMKDTSLVSVIGFTEVVQVGRDIQSDTFNSSGLIVGALLFLAVTIPLARLVDILIARQQRRTSRGGSGGAATPTPATQASGPTGGPV
jgi:ABC-type amino acid transport system permease subunit